MSTSSSTKVQRDVMGEIVSAVIEHLERGVMPWRKSWKDRKPVAGEGVPHNAISGRPYNGINFLQLSMVGIRYTSQSWLTFNQAREAGGSVRKGEKGTAIVFWKPMDKTKREEDGTLKHEKFLMLKTFTVFNVEQCDGLKLPKRRAVVEPVAPVDPNDAMGPARCLVGALVGCSVSYGGNQAFYSPGADAIRLPEPGQFSSMDHFRATLAHEASHATGAKHRLDRNLTGRFGSDSYAAEELVAELSAAMVGARLGLDTSLLEHHSSYLAGWLKVLKDDRKALLTAASLAQKACDYLCPVAEEVEQPASGSQAQEEQGEQALAMAA